MKIVDRDAGRPGGRLRVRVLHDATNRLVAYPDGRTRYFGSEEAADEWIQQAKINPADAERALRSWKP